MEEARGTGNGQKTILLVDDEEMVIEVGEQMLKSMGYDVLLARSGREAIEILWEACGHGDGDWLLQSRSWKGRGALNVPDLVILDVVMPEMGGSETYEQLRQISPHIKVLLASGYSIEDQAQDILSRGCDGFIQKPFNLRQLSVKIREIMD